MPSGASITHDALIASAHARMLAMFSAMRADPVVRLAIEMLSMSSDRSEAEQRFPLMLAVSDMMAKQLGLAVNCWTGAERETMRARFQALFEQSVAESADKVDGWLSEIDPLRARQRGNSAAPADVDAKRSGG